MEEHYSLLASLINTSLQWHYPNLTSYCKWRSCCRMMVCWSSQVYFWSLKHAFDLRLVRSSLSWPWCWVLVCRKVMLIQFWGQFLVKASSSCYPPIIQSRIPGEWRKSNEALSSCLGVILNTGITTIGKRNIKFRSRVGENKKNQICYGEH